MKINENLSYVNGKLAKIEKDIYKIKILIERWQLTLNEAKTQNIPEGLLTSITNFQNEINKAFVEFEAEEANLLSIQSELTQLLISVTDVKHELEREFYALQTNYLKRSEPPIWKATPSKKSISDIKEYYKNSIDKDLQTNCCFLQVIRLFRYIKRFILVILLVVLFFYLKKDSLKQSIPEKDKKYLFAKNIVTTQPLLLSLVSILSLFVLFFQNTMYSIALLLQLLLIGIYYLMLTKRFRIKYKPILISIMWLIVINSFVIYFDANDIYVRFLLLISAFIAFRVFYKLNNELHKFEDIISPNSLKAIRAVIGLFGVFSVGRNFG